MPDESLDPHAILQTLGLLATTSVTLVQGSTDTTIWRVEDAGKVYALRVFRRGQQDGCQQEQAAMQVAQAAGLPVPKVYAAGNWNEHPALLLAWLPGKTVTEELFAHPWRVWHLGYIFGRMQAKIHTVIAPDLLCQEATEWISWLGPGEEALQARLRAVNSQSNALLHLDFHPFNVLTDGKRITGVLDWRNACGGDPRADAARTASILRIDTIGRPRLPELAIRVIFERAWRRGYEQVRGKQGDLSIFYAWAGAVMERDLASKRDAADLARIHRWTLGWKKRVGCT